MEIKNADGTRMVLEVTDQERNVARQVKIDFKEILKKMNEAIITVSDLKNAIVEQHPSKEDLRTKYSGRLLRYRRKIKTAFNAFLAMTKNSLDKLLGISDPDMIRLREIIIAEIGELSDGAEAILDLLDDVDKEGFTKTLEQIAVQMVKRQKSIIDVIDSQLFNHIDHDILGRMKVSELRFKIRRRARILKQLGRSLNV